MATVVIHMDSKECETQLKTARDLLALRVSDSSWSTKASAAVEAAQRKLDLCNLQQGYDAQWIDSPLEDYYCPMCLHVVRDAVAHSCGKVFCGNCWKEWARRDQGCCCCKQSGEALASLRDQKVISNLKIACHACQMQFRLADYQQHLENKCIHRLIKCTKCPQLTTSALSPIHQRIHCASRPVPCSACKSEVSLSALCDHQKFDCTHRETMCPACGKPVLVLNLPEHKKNHCDFRSIICTECKQTTTPRKLAAHLKLTCPARDILCALCQMPIKSSKMADHLQSSVGTHLLLLLEQRESDRKTIKDLRQVVSDLEERVNVLLQRDE